MLHTAPLLLPWGVRQWRLTHVLQPGSALQTSLAALASRLLRALQTSLHAAASHVLFVLPMALCVYCNGL